MFLSLSVRHGMMLHLATVGDIVRVRAAAISLGSALCVLVFQAVPEIAFAECVFLSAHRVYNLTTNVVSGCVLVEFIITTMVRRRPQQCMKRFKAHLNAYYFKIAFTV